MFLSGFTKLNHTELKWMQFQNSELHINNLTPVSAEEEQCRNVTGCRPVASFVSPWPRISVSTLTSPESRSYYWITLNSASLPQRWHVSATRVHTSLADSAADWPRPLLWLFRRPVSVQVAPCPVHSVSFPPESGCDACDKFFTLTLFYG